MIDKTNVKELKKEIEYYKFRMFFKKFRNLRLI